MKDRIVHAIKHAADVVVRAALSDGARVPEFTVERPPDPTFGDYSTNVAMVLPKLLRRPPRDIAQAIAAELQSCCSACEKVEVAGPGFINLTVAHECHTELIRTVLALPEESSIDTSQRSRFGSSRSR